MSTQEDKGILIGVPEHAVGTSEDIQTDEAVEKLYFAGPLRLMWWRFRKHRLAMISLVIIIVFYLTAIFAEFVAPNDPQLIRRHLGYASPTKIHFIDADGKLNGPFVYGITRERDPETLVWIYKEDTGRKYPIRLFVRGEPYELWGLFETDLHLFGIDTGGDESMALLLAGTDQLGRDVFSRIVYGARLSLSVGLVGVALSLVLGIILGGLSGYFGGVVDVLIQRLIEIIRSIPSIPLWMALAAAVPRTWGITQTYFAITIILSLIGWTGLARTVRGKFLSLREEEFVMAAKVVGTSELKIIFSHILPSFMSHIIAVMTLAVPSMILGETGLSFLGLGLRPPALSWGVLLQDAQNLSALSLYPWLLSPAIFIVIIILAFNFVGDGLRDAADPYVR